MCQKGCTEAGLCIGLGKHLSHNLGSKEVPKYFLPQIVNKAPWVFRIRKKNKKVNHAFILVLSSILLF